MISVIVGRPANINCCQISTSFFDLHRVQMKHAGQYSDTVVVAPLPGSNTVCVVYQVYRRSQEPQDKSRYIPKERKSYYNLLKEYNSEEAREALPGVFEYLQVFYNEPKYPGTNL